MALGRISEKARLRKEAVDEIYKAADALEVPRERIAPILARGLSPRTAEELYAVFESTRWDRFTLAYLGTYAEGKMSDAELIDGLRSIGE